MAVPMQCLQRYGGCEIPGSPGSLRPVFAAYGAEWPWYADGSLPPLPGGLLGAGSGPAAVMPGGEGCGGFNSFSADTRVLLADGRSKPIGEVVEGDVVQAADPVTGEAGGREVTKVWVHEDTLVELALADGSRVTTTEDHPFWSGTDRRYERADDLTTGEVLVDPTGAGTPVDGLVPGSQREGVAYNLTVDDLSTYYVLAGDTPVLAHNCNGGVYVFIDKETGLPFVGQTNDFDRRLKGHARGGRRDNDDPVTCIEVCGDQNDREAVEAEIIDLLGGKEKLANTNNSPGLSRRGR